MKTKYQILLICLQRLLKIQKPQKLRVKRDISNTKATLNTEVTEIENKVPDTTGFITTPEFNRLTKISFGAKMKQAAKILVSKNSSR